jgi:pilus assembly protein CpaC
MKQLRTSLVLVAPLALAFALFAGVRAEAQTKTGKPDPTAKPSASAPVLATQVTEELNLSVGENKTIAATGVKNYSEGTPGFVDVKVSSDGKTFIVVGLKPGSTSLLLIKDNGQEVNWIINVFARSPAVVETELKQLLEGYTGVKVRRVGSRLFIEGSVATEADVKRIGQIALLYGGQVESLVGVGGGKDRTNIRVDFFFVQYERTSGYQVGVSWPTTIGGTNGNAAVIGSNVTWDAFAPAGHTTSITGSIVNQPLPALDIASNYGWAKVIKQATLVTTNGTDAMIENGGEVNFYVTAGLTAALQKIKFGTQVNVQPFYDPVSREIELKIQADVADLAPAGTGTTLPSLTTSKLQTVVHMKLGQSLVISGIHTEDERKSSTGLPLLSQIPILGYFFGTHGLQKKALEGAVFIVPSVVETGTATAADVVNETWKVYEDWSGTPILGDPVPRTYDRKPNDFVPPEKKPAEKTEKK